MGFLCYTVGMNTRRSFSLWCLVGLLVATPAQATAPNTDWQHARSLGRDPQSISTTGTLGGTGSVRYYQVRVSAPTDFRVYLDIDGNGKPTAQPRLVLFQPDEQTIGPALPIAQPPSTIATVFAATDNTRMTSGPWLSVFTRRLSSTITLPSAGTHFLAVYNASEYPGSFRLMLERSDVSGTPIATRLHRWFSVGLWTAPQVITLLLPVLATALATLTWVIIHRLPHPKRRYAKKTSS